MVDGLLLLQSDSVAGPVNGATIPGFNIRRRSNETKRELVRFMVALLRCVGTGHRVVHGWVGSVRIIGGR